MKRRFVPLFAFLLFCLVLAFALLMRPRHDIIELSGSEVMQPLPALALRTRDGTAVTINVDAVKGKVTLINFFASWCTACVEDHHELLELAHDRPNMPIIGIAWNDTPLRTDDWLAQHRNPFARVLFDKEGKSAIALGVRGLPESFLVDANGRIRYRIAAPITPQVRTGTIEPLIDELAGQQ